MDNLIDDYQKARAVFIKTMNQFPGDKRTAVLFGAWSLKDIMAHIIGWEKLSVEKVAAVKNGQPIKWVDDVDKQNAKVVDEYKLKDWDEVYGELIQSGNKMIKEYESLPANLWIKQAGPSPKDTPQRFLEQETKHYQGNHLQEIQDYLKIPA